MCYRLRSLREGMDPEVLARFHTFEFSSKENDRVDLREGHGGGREEFNREVFGDKKANLVGVGGTMMKPWGARGLHKIIPLDQNIFQFVFKTASDREWIIQGRPWFFDNQLLLL